MEKGGGEEGGGEKFLALKDKWIPVWSVCMQAEEDATLFRATHSTNKHPE